MEATGLRRVWLLSLAALSVNAAAVAGDSAPARSSQAAPRQIVKMRLAGEQCGTRNLGNGNCQWLEPHDRLQKRLLEEPKYKSNKPIYYAARYGDGNDSMYTLVLDESKGPGKGYDTVYIDANNDRRIDAVKERFPIRVGDLSASDPLRVRLQVASGGVTAPYYVSIFAFPYYDAKFPIPGIHITLRDSSYYVGEAVFAGKLRKIALADLNGNGLFNDVEQAPLEGDRFYVALDDSGQFYQSFPCGRFAQVAGAWYSIAASPDGGRVEIAAAKPPLGSVEAPGQIVGARLNSPEQSRDLDFQDGWDQAVAGTYRLHSVQLLADSGWALSGFFPDGEPEVIVRENKTVRLAAGLPLKVEPQVVADDDRTLRVSLRVLGAGGESYRWSPRRGSAAKAGFEIFDASGKRLASAGFEYG